MAMDQAATTATKYGLPQTDSESLTSEAVARATAREACNLRWDATTKSYQLDHPTLAAGAPQTFTIAVEGTAGLTSTNNHNHNHNQGRINLLSPTDTGSNLVSLDLNTKTLTINTAALIKNHPSLYIIDVSVTAVLTVALVEGRRLATAATACQTPTLSFSAPPTIAEMEEGRGKVDFWEKYADGERELPTATRGVLRVLFGGLRVVVWALTLLVGLLAKLVVGASAVVQRA